MAATIALPSNIGHVKPPVLAPRLSRWREGAEQQAIPLNQQITTGPLRESDIVAIAEKTRRFDGALRTLDRIDTAVEDARVQHSAYRGFSVVGLWSQAVSFFRRGFGVRAAEPAVRKQILESEISQRVGEVRRVVEKVIMPDLADVRTTYRERTFTKTKDTPPALLLVSVPVDKVGKAVSFGAFQATVKEKAEASAALSESDGGEARCILSRVRDDIRETLECAYHRPGKVVVYLNGERQGTMWNDDALKLVSAFADNKAIKLKRARFEEYAVQ